MKAWLIVNTFMASEKFKNLYQLLSDAFKKHGVSLEIKKAENSSQGRKPQKHEKNK